MSAEGDTTVGPSTLFAAAHRQPNAELKAEAVRAQMEAYVQGGRFVLPCSLTAILNEEEPYRRLALAVARELGVSVEFRVLQTVRNDVRKTEVFGQQTRLRTVRQTLEPTPKGKTQTATMGQTVAGLSLTQLFFSYAKGVFDVEVRATEDNMVRIEEVPLAAVA